MILSRMWEAFSTPLYSAIEAAAPGGCELSISARPDHEGRQEGAGEVMVEFVDSGPGMTEETLKNAFTPFFTTKEKGTGMGLTVVRQILAAHRGSISMHSELGVGTRVKVRLPDAARDIQALPGWEGECESD